MNDGKAYNTVQRELLSEDIHEIINYRPHWIIRKGNLMFLGIILFLLSLAFVISYPDMVKATVRLTAANAPKMLEATTEGKIVRLMVRDGEQVKANQALAYLQSTAKHEQVLQLMKWITETELLIANDDLKKISTHTLPELKDLGELQNAFQELSMAFKENQQVLPGGYYQKKMAALGKDLHFLSALRNNAVDQKSLVTEDQQLQEKEYAAYEKLAAEKVIAPMELNQYKSKLLSKEQNLRQAESQLTSNSISSHSKRKELLELQKMMTDVEQLFQSSLFDLKSKVESWLQRYILSAPESGGLEFVSPLQENQLVNTGQQLFFIQPPESGYYAEMKAGQSGLGKIKVGQKVIIKLPSYPSSEFGHIQGVVRYISNMPNERDSFLVKVELPNGLQTNYNKQIVFRNNLSASAEIITDDRRLIDRVFGNFKQLTKR